MMGPLGLIGYGVENGDLVVGVGGGFPTRPVHAYIPMRGVNWEGLKFMEDPPVAYLDQMRAKRVAANFRKRSKTRPTKKYPNKPMCDYTSVVGIIVK